MITATYPEETHLTDTNARRSEIVLIGPVGAGKSTVGEILAARLGLPVRQLDLVTWEYAAEYGFGSEEFSRAIQEEGFLAADRRLHHALEYALERFLAEHRDCIFDLGAGHPHHEDEELNARARAALAPFEHVILILPSPDLDASVQTLKERNRRERRGSWLMDERDYFEHWVKDPQFHQLATATVYTDGKTPEETADEILRVMGM